MTITDGSRRRADGPLQRMAVKFHGQPRPARWATAGAVCLGVIGAVAGLVIGLIVHPPTAPFALFELGLPATLVGGAVGFVAGLIVEAGLRFLPGGGGRGGRLSRPDDRGGRQPRGERS